MKIWKIADSENERYFALQALRKLSMEKGSLKINLLRSSITSFEIKEINVRISYIDQQIEKIKQIYNFKLPDNDKREDWEKSIDWDGVNWNESDETIAKKTRTSLLSVKRMRKRLERWIS